MGQDRTAQERTPIRHEHPHTHFEPTPHLRAANKPEPADDHGLGVEHFHVHLLGGEHPYNHGGHTHDDDDLKHYPDPADDNG